MPGSNSYRHFIARLLGLLLLGGGLVGVAPLHAQTVGFEGGTLPSNWLQPSGSDASWSVVSATSSSGTYSLRSDDIGDDQTAAIEVTVSVPVDSVITFDYQVSSESGYDYLRFYVDGMEKLGDSGNTNWLSSGEISVSAGTHTFRWAYEKDGSVTHNSDAAWIDNVALPTMGPPTQVEAQAASVGDVLVDWRGAGAAQYKLYRDTAPIDSAAGPSSYTAVATVEGGGAQYVDTGTQVGTEYYYRITSVDSSGNETPFSEQTSVVPGHAATALEPRSGTPGTRVQIYGKGFDPTAANNTVWFGGTQATVTSAQPSIMTVEVPSVSVADVPVTVDTGSERDTVETSFQVLASNTGTRTFAAASLTGVSQSASAWGDYDNDNDRDLVIAGGGTTTLYENDGNGNFAPAGLNLSGVGTGASVAWSDYNGDDYLDLVVTGALSTVIYKNDAQGGLSSIAAGLEGVNLGEAGWGDYDSDGDPDPVVSGQNSSGVPTTTLYRNEGSDTFTPVSNAGLPDLQNSSVAWADYNNDGRLDLAVAGVDGTSTPTTQIYRNEGDSTFTAVGAGLAGVGAGTVEWVDYNGDGALDLLVTGDEGSNVASTTLYRNDGGGTFTPVGAGLADLYNSDADWGDYDGDGDPDLVLVGRGSADTTAVLYRNDGMGDFSSVSAGLTGVTKGSVDWGDQNGDGVLDLVLTGVDANNVASARIYESNSAPPPPPAGLSITTYADSVQLRWSPVGASDLAEYRIYRDTAPIDSAAGPSVLTEIAAVGADSTSYSDPSVTTGTTYYYRVTAVDGANTESGFSSQAAVTPSFQVTRFFPTSATAGSSIRVYSNGFDPTASSNTVSFLDTTGADLPATVTDVRGTVLSVEVPSGLAAPARIAVQRSDGTADTTAARFVPVQSGIGDRSFASVGAGLTGIAGGTGGGDVAWGDYDRDGDLDVVIVGPVPSGAESTIGSARMYRNDGGGTFTPISAGLTGLKRSSVDWGDYDQDGDLDLVLSGQNSSFNPQTLIYRNDGGSTFTPVSTGLEGLEEGDVAWGDYDGDGDQDLVVTGMDGGLTRRSILYRNEGGGRFAAVQTSLADVNRGTVEWGDYDSDGDSDLLLTGLNSSGSEIATIYRNDGGTFTPAGANLTGVSDGGGDWGDYDGDGDLDLVLTGGANSTPDETTTLYRNDGSGTFTGINAGLVDVKRSDVDWGDYDGDGDLDVVIAGRGQFGTAKTYVYRNDGGGAFNRINAGLVGVEYSTVAWGDYNGDGALDPLVIGPDGNFNATATLYQSRPAPPAPSTLSARAVEGTQTRLQWSAPSAGDVAEYRIYRSTSSIAASQPSSLTPYDSVSVGTRAFVDSAVTANTRYYYRVSTVDTTTVESDSLSPEASVEPKPATGTLYVDQSATGANDGSSWNDAFVHLQDAVDSVNVRPVTDFEIRVAEGTYYPDEDGDGDHSADDAGESFRIEVDDVSLLGGYPAGGGARDPDAHRTVLSGDLTQNDTDPDGDGVIASPTALDSTNAHTVLFFEGTDRRGEGAGRHTVIRGVTITAGAATGAQESSQTDGQEYGSVVSIGALEGGGAFCSAVQVGRLCAPRFRNVTFRGNIAGSGGAFATYSAGGSTSAPSFRNVTFRANRADSTGGAVFLRTYGGTSDSTSGSHQVRPRFTKTVFQNNRALSGGAVGATAGQGGRVRSVFVNATFRVNRATQRGGAVYGTGEADGVLRSAFVNSLFANNYAGDEGGAAFVAGTNDGTVAPLFLNATLVGNTADVVGGALYNENAATPQLVNSILWGNEAGAGSSEVANNDATPVFDHSLVDGSGGSGRWDTSLGTDGGGNLDANPLFVDTSAAVADFRLQEDSPVIDAGLNSAVPEDSTDLDLDGDSTETLPLGLADSTRIADGDGNGTATVNPGAYEDVGPDRTALTAPASLSIIAFTDSLRVAWPAVADGDLAKYRIYRDTVAIDSVAGPSRYVPYDSAGAGTTAFIDSSVAADSTYHYRITSVDNSGNESSFSAEVQARPAAALTVWPGDTDNDGAVNQNDVLPLGFQWGQTGPARDSTGCAFKGRVAAAWPTQAATYADANGDGTVDQNDVLCIGLNWGDSTATAKAAPLYASTPKTARSSVPSATGGRQPPVPVRSPGKRREDTRRQGVHRAGGRSGTGVSGRVSSSAETGRLVLDAPTEPDSVLWVEVRAENLPEVSGTAFEVAYPASKVTVRKVKLSDWFGDEALTQSHVNNERGTVGVGLVAPDSVHGGSGTLARLKIHLGKAVTESVQLTLRHVRSGTAAGRIGALGTGTGVRVQRVPETFKLYGNYPNPVRQSTAIRYDLPSNRHVRLRVYDVLGRHVATLVDETQKAGQKTVTWHTERMASGVYLYRLTAGDESDTGKLTIVR